MRSSNLLAVTLTYLSLKLVENTKGKQLFYLRRMMIRTEFIGWSFQVCFLGPD